MKFYPVFAYSQDTTKNYMSQQKYNARRVWSWHLKFFLSICSYFPYYRMNGSVLSDGLQSYLHNLFHVTHIQKGR